MSNENTVRPLITLDSFSRWLFNGVSVGVLALAFMVYGELKQGNEDEQRRFKALEESAIKRDESITELRVSMVAFTKESESNRKIMQTQTQYLKNIADNVVGVKELRELESQLRDIKKQISKTTSYDVLAWNQK